MLLSIIVSLTQNRVIGSANRVPWDIPRDREFFQNVTYGNTVVMGRKTFESIGEPLPDRYNIILTRKHDFRVPSAIVVSNLDEAFKHADQLKAKETFFIGGEEIYRQTLPLVERLYLSQLQISIEGDAHFPPVNLEEWKQIGHHDYPPNRKRSIAFEISLFERKNLSQEKELH